MAHDVDLGASFAGMHAGVNVDELGRVTVVAGKALLYSDLGSIGVEVPTAVSDILEKDGTTRKHCGC